MEEIKQHSPSVSGYQNAAIDLQAFDEPCLKTDLICLSHLRWDFVYQRPQHLLSRFAKHRRVFFVEEPIFGDVEKATLDISRREDALHVAVPRLPHGLPHDEVVALQRKLIDDLIATMDLNAYTLWYYTPMALPFTRHLSPERVIYDCMDELSAFKGAPPALLQLEAELFNFADHVFTGGHSLYEAKKNKHESAHPFPSSIDYNHFAKARKGLEDPADQAAIPHPRVGFFGVVDERFDIDLIAGAAKLRPDWQFVIVGPVVKIDPASLPQLPNVHYLGQKSYKELPAYLAHWDLAMLPFALNESTRFISPTKTPEYLAAGKPVVSTAIRDVIRPYGEEGLVHIVGSPEEFVREGELAMKEKAHDRLWLERVDQFLANTSWDATWSGMAELEKSTNRDMFAESPREAAANIH